MGQDLRDELKIGMTYDDLVSLLGEPTNVNDGANLLEGNGVVVASDSTRSLLSRTLFCYWERDEARYFLNVVDGKLAKIHSIDPPIKGLAPRATH